MSDQVTTGNDNDGDAESTRSFMDLFALHFASRLVGREHLLKQFNSKKAQYFRVYWRSPLLSEKRRFDGPICVDTLSLAATTLTESNEQQSEWNVVFLDVTVTFDRLKKKLTVVFGMMLQQQQEQEEECAHVTTAPLSFSQLSRHCENIGIDIESTKPDAIARSMGDALMGIKAGQSVKLERNGSTISTPKDLRGVSSFEMPVSLTYSELQETDSLKLTSDSVCVLNASTSFMMLYSVESIDEHSKESAGGAKGAAELTTSFEEWWSTPVYAEKRSNGGTSEPAEKWSTLDDGLNKPPTGSSGGLENVVANGSCSHSSSSTDKATATQSKTMSSNVSILLPPPPAITAAATSTKPPPEKEEPKRPPIKRAQAGYVQVKPKKKRGKLTFAKANK